MKINLNDTITFVGKNSRKATAAGFGVHAHYQTGATLNAVIAAITAAGITHARDHVRWDLNKGAIRVGDPVVVAAPRVSAEAARAAAARTAAFFAAANRPVAELADTMLAASLAEHKTARRRNRRAAA